MPQSLAGCITIRSACHLFCAHPWGGRRGYAATHSQSLEKHFLGVPGTQVLCLHHRYSPARLYEDLCEHIHCPTLVIENKVVYGQYVDTETPDGFNLRYSDSLFPMVNMSPGQPADLTLVALGGISIEAEAAVLDLFEECEVLVDLYLPTCFYPFDIKAILPSVLETGKLLVVEEGQGFVSLGSEIIAQVAECREVSQGIGYARLAARPCPIPASRPLEEECLPDSDAIVKKALELLSGV